MQSISQYNLDGLGAEFKTTEEVEKQIAKILGVKHCIMTTSGTAAIFLALRAVGAKKVAVPSLTMIATATAAELAGCELYFVSGNEIPDECDTYVHVSLNGRSCGIEEVIKNHRKLNIIEDACQAFGSKVGDKYLGTLGRAGCISFQAYKIVSSGNGGCVITDDDGIATNVQRLKNFGREAGGQDRHDYIGYNFKFTDIQAKFMLPQLQELDTRLSKKQAMYSRYYQSLSDIMLPHPSVPWACDIYVDERDRMMEYLKSKDIGTRKMYPILTTQKPFAGYEIHGDSRSDISRSERGLWLPSSIDITNEEIDYVIDAIKSFK